MAKETVKIPDLGGGSVDVIEVCVAVGDVVAKEDSLVVLESDKASMEIPSPMAGKVLSISLKEGATVEAGDAILELEVEVEVEAETEAEDAKPDAKDQAAPAASAAPEKTAPAAEPAQPAKQEKSSAREMIKVPDVGSSDGIDVIEVCVAVGDVISEGDSLLVLESDKASMEVPSPYSGKITKIVMKVGDSAKVGAEIAEIEREIDATGDVSDAKVEVSAPEKETSTPPVASSPASAAPAAKPEPTVTSHADVYAGPAVRKLAREFGLELEQMTGTAVSYTHLTLPTICSV